MKKVIGVILAIIILSLIGFGIYYYPKYIEKKEIKNLEDKVYVINKYLVSSEKEDNLDTYLQENNSTGERNKVEEALNSYLSALLKDKEKVDNILSNEEDKLSIENIDKDKLEDIIKKQEEKKTKLNETLESINETVNNQENFITKLTTNEKEISLFNRLLKDKINLETLVNQINDESLNIDNNKKILEYLKSNKDKWKRESDSITFLKRNKYNEFENTLKKLNIDNISYDLIKDTKGPTIIASDITITKGTKVDLKSKFKCNDDVDDSVTCKIDGSYDVNKVGTYSIRISATDTSKNTSSKTVKLNVKEKVVNKKPYYIEVIRNHNIVIVYGLDSNNEYKKVVKVFVCSVGKNNKTPTGTFTTSDKASWGWLVGNVYGQYYTRIKGSILFHSVPYFKKAKNQLEWEEFNKLGTAASKGCVRLTVRDVKWIYDNCPRGTTVKIYDGQIPSGITKPTAPKISADSPNKGWDPTDPDKNNPWKK